MKSPVITFKCVCRGQGKEDTRGSRIGRPGGKKTVGLLVCQVHCAQAFAGWPSLEVAIESSSFVLWFCDLQPRISDRRS